MGCGPSAPKAPPAPNNAPSDWQDAVSEAFKALDKGGTGAISTAAAKKDDGYSDILVLPDDIKTKQIAASDLPTVEKMDGKAWEARMKENIEKVGWAPVKAFLDAIVSGTAKDESCDQLARTVFTTIDEKWCEPAKTGKVDLPKEFKDIGDNTEAKAATILAGLTEGTAVDVEAWVANVKSKVAQSGWWVVMKELKAVSARLEKVAELDSMM